MSENVQPSPPKPWEKKGARPDTMPQAPAATLPAQNMTDATQVAPDAPVKHESGVSTSSSVQPQTSLGNSSNMNTQGMQMRQSQGFSPYSNYNNGMYGNGYGGGMYNNGLGGFRGGMGPYAPYGSAGMPLSNMGMVLGNIQHATNSLSQLGELLGMNVDAIGYAFMVGTTLVEKGGRGLLHLLNFATGRVDLSQYPTVDPQTGQPVHVPSETEVLQERKRRVKHWFLGLVAVALGWQVLKKLVSLAFHKKLSSAEVMEQTWDRISGISKPNSPSLLQNALSMAGPPQNGLGMGSPMGYGGYGSYGGYNGHGIGGYNGYGMGGYGSYGSGMYSNYGQYY